MKNLRLTIFFVTLAFYLMGISAVYSSEVIDHEIDSKQIAGNKVGFSSLRKFQVYLPDEYRNNESERYPVLYWIPGWGGGVQGNNYKKSIDDAIKSGKIPPTIAVFVDAHEQIWFLNSVALGNWENLLTMEIIPFIDKNYRTIADPLARGLMGHSAGGYTAFMLPVRNPNVWGSIGCNDPALSAMYAYIRDKEDLIFFPTFDDIQPGYKDLPKDIGAYKSVANWYSMDLIQLGTAFSPNLDSPLLCDLPADGNGNWFPEVREKWSNYDLSNSQTLDKYSKILKDLISITIVTPTGPGAGDGAQNSVLIKQFRSAGINITQLDMPGGHGDHSEERFIAIAEQLLKAMIGAEVSVSPRNNLVTTWGEMKR